VTHTEYQFLCYFKHGGIYDWLMIEMTEVVRVKGLCTSLKFLIGWDSHFCGA
jgi:hypothetical protein